jgi:hypothetical protein
MPSALFRLLAVLFLVITIPVQGLAAVTAGQCMALGHHDDRGGQENHAHAHDGVDDHDHDQAGDSHSGDTAVNGDEGGKASHCGPCAACCASATIAGSARLSILSAPYAVEYLFSQFPPLGVQPAGLDRPPLAL